ncbi:RxLR effector protein [Phytophthora megakarya]|uniref:RxLR effector protein n=1 Tax=Phytophthora megakarya TaxID=4795 RepID=A0A225X1P0_9STRA|nr:RxLR effector protein [Phytophthora megakarya]
MRSHKILLIVAVIILSLVTSPIIASGISVPNVRSFRTNQHNILTKRVLRAHTTSNANDEERLIPSLDKIFEGGSKVINYVTLKHWLWANKPVDKALDTLKLNTGVEKALLNPNLKTLDKYVNMFNEKHPKQQISLAGVLISRYGDEALTKAIIKALETENSKNIAIKLQKQQMEGWLNSQLSIGNVLDKPKLNTGVENAILHPNLKILDNYVSMFRKKNPEQHVSLTGTLASRYGDEPLAMALLTARHTDNSNMFLKRLQAGQLADWGYSRKPVNEVFALLKIKDDDIRALISPKLVTLNKYIVLSDIISRERTDLFTALRTGFGPDNFAILLSRAMDDPDTAATALKYQWIQFKRWIARDYDLMTVLNVVFNKDKLAAASARERSVIDTYKPMYYEANGLDQVNTNVAPRV